MSTSGSSSVLLDQYCIMILKYNSGIMSRSGSSSGSGVRCIINLANWSMFTMLDVETNTECGRTNKEFPPRNVFPGYRYVGIHQDQSSKWKQNVELCFWVFHLGTSVFHDSCSIREAFIFKKIIEFLYWIWLPPYMAEIIEEFWNY